MKTKIVVSSMHIGHTKQSNQKLKLELKPY